MAGLLRGVLGLAGALLLLGAGFGLFVGLFGAQAPEADTFAHFRLHFALAAVGAAVLGVLSSSWRLALTGLAAAGGGVALLGPALLEAQRPVDPAACGARVLTVATANVLYVNDFNAEAAAALDRVDVDILVTQETSEAFWNEASGLQQRFPHRVARLRTLTPTYNVVLWSKFPLRDGVENNLSPDAPMRAQAIVDLGGGLELGVVGLHFSLPAPIQQNQRSQGLALGALMNGLPDQRILLGDFNASPWSAQMRIVQEQSGSEIIGGLRRTWRGGYPNPFGPEPIPSALGNQIDHILVSEGIGVIAVDTFDIPGSDHLGVRATIEVPEPC
ncbi:MAG: endonuclease/exonuclease/phosphatase family protein [Pseudomonadota bacterium]